MRYEETPSSKDDKSQKTFAGRIAQIFNKNSDMFSGASMKIIDSDQSVSSKAATDEIKTEDQSSNNEPFDELMKKKQSTDNGSEIPENLPGGVLIDQLYIIAPEELNAFLFSPDSNFLKSLADLQGTSELQVGSWKFENVDGTETLKRPLTYVKPPSKIVKAVKAYEDQTYIKADGKNFVVLTNVSTPEIMYGNTFKVEVLYIITPGPELASGEQCTRLVISWRLIFVQSTMMKGIIENGARQGFKDNFSQFADLLFESVKPVDSKDLGSSKEQILASLQAEQQSDWELAVQYFANFTAVITVAMGLYVLVHIWLAAPSVIQGLECLGLDLPDSIGELAVCAVVVLQAERVMGLLSRFMQARSRNCNPLIAFFLPFL